MHKDNSMESNSGGTPGRVQEKPSSVRQHVSDDAVLLAARLRALPDNHQAILITSAADRTPIGVLSLDIARALASLSEAPVLFVDTNYHDPCLPSELSDRADVVGLFELVRGQADLATAVRRSEDPNLFLLPVGHGGDEVRALLMSEELGGLMERLRQTYRFIIVTSAPIFLHPDFAILATRTDGVVLAITAGKHTTAEVSDLKRWFDSLRLRFFGVVICEKSD